MTAINISANRKSVLFLLMAGAALLLLFYVIQVNSFTRERYFLKSQQEKLKNLSANNDDLKIDFSKSNSLAKIDEYIAKNNFKRVSGQKFIQIMDNQMAKR